MDEAPSAIAVDELPDTVASDQLEQQILSACFEQRRKIGLELHDDLGQRLTAVAFLAAFLARDLARTNSPSAKDAFKMEKLLGDAVSQIRLLARGLFPAALEDGGLLGALERLAEDARAAYRIECRVLWHASASREDSSVALHLYRICQEALSNAVRHGKASRVTIELLKPRLDPEFRSLIPPLTAEERDQLERNIRDFGRARDPLVCWQGLLLDGHNRYEICETFALPYTVTEASCATRDEAKVWIIRNQFGRRNLQPFQRVELALKLEPLIASKAKENQRASGGAVPQKSAEPVETRKEIAKAAGVSHDTITKGKVISQKAPEAVKEQLRRGEISINSAYQDIRGSERRIERVERIQAVTAQNNNNL